MVSRLATQLVFAALLCTPAAALCADGAALQARYQRLQPALAHSTFGAPLAVASADDGEVLAGEVDAVVRHRFERVRRTLATPGKWCEVLVLHLNVKRCVAGEGGDVLVIAMGRKLEQDLDDTQELALSFERDAATSTHLAVRLHADEGPLGTHDYDLALEAIPVGDDRSYLHLAYSSAYGAAARLAMKGYLATVGRDRVGFSSTGVREDGSPILVGGLRGAIERNVMRYYLAIDACLATATLPPAERREARLEAWFDATRRYPRQFDDLTREEYLQSKRRLPAVPAG